MMSSPMSQPNHPVWAFARLVVMLIALTAVLYIYANDFDATEVRTIVTMFLVGASVEGLPAIMSKMGKSGQ